MAKKKRPEIDFSEEASEYGITWTVRRDLIPSLEPDDYIIRFEGTIFRSPDRTGGSEEVAGNVSGRVVEAARAFNDDEDLFDVCDSDDQSLHEFHHALYDEDDPHRMKDSVSDGCAGSDLLVLDLLEVLPQHRGKRLGLFAMLRTIEMFGRGCAAAVLKPFPLQFDVSRIHSSDADRWRARMGMAGFEQNQEIATKKLRRYWGLLGFEPVGKTEFFALDLQCERPGFDDLGAPRG